MLRVCGVTFDHTNNYGSCLQAFALQKAVEKTELNGESCEYRVLYLRKLFLHQMKEYNASLFRRVSDFQHLRFLKFEKEYMKYIETENMSMDSLQQLNKEFDAFVCGSDVIWNEDLNFGRTVYFLDFAEKYKFSYAASFGTDRVSDEYIRRCSKMISDLDEISVRETTSKKLLESHIDKAVEVVPDPVLLLDREDWETIVSRVTVPKKKYIFAYFTHINPKAQVFIKRLQKETGLRVINAIWVSNLRIMIENRIFLVQTPQKWLALLKNAEYIVTNSFHASVLSCVFHRRFFTFVNGEPDKGVNIRMYDYLKKLGLESRMFSAVPEVIDTSNCSFDSADRVNEELKMKGLDYLHRNLQNACNESLKINNHYKSM